MKANNLATESARGKVPVPIEERKLPISAAEILEILPHRYPFLLVDQVIAVIPQTQIVGIKNVSANEPFFQGHFPGRPIMPGVLMLEALAQLGAVFSKISSDRPYDETLMVFSGAEDVRFRRQVVPGEVLRLQMTVLKRKFNVWKMDGKAFVGDEVACEAILTASEIS